MRTDNAEFASALAAASISPRFTLQVAFDDGETDLAYLLSHNDSGYPAGGISITGIKDLAGVSQKIDPQKATATIGGLSFSVLDTAGALSALIAARLDDLRGLRHKLLRVYMGVESLAWLSYEQQQTYLISDISFSDGVYYFTCDDIQRITRKKIFSPHRCKLNASISADALVIPIANYTTAEFPTVAHDADYGDAPSSTVGYGRIEDETFRFTGITTDSVLGLSFVVDVGGRGALGTTAKAHDVTAGTNDDNKPAISEWVYIDGPAVKIAYYVLTGIDPLGVDDPWPDHWHAGVATSQVRLADFTGIGDDVWDTSTGAGVPVRFENPKETDAKQFIETELLLWLSAFMPIYASGELGIRRLAPVLSDAAHVLEIGDDDIGRYGKLRHDLKDVQNRLRVDWNRNPATGKTTRTTRLVDADSITLHGKADERTLTFKGVHTGKVTEEKLATAFDAFRDRASHPPQRLDLTVLPKHGNLEVGDVVKVTTDRVFDFAGGITSIARAFEVQRVAQNYTTGAVSLALFGSSRRAGSLDHFATGNRLPDDWYTTGGATDLSTVITITAGAVTTDQSIAAGDYYYTGDLTINAGVSLTVNTAGVLRLSVRGFLQIDGAIDATGQGGAGGIGATQTDATGRYGSTRGTNGIHANASTNQTDVAQYEETGDIVYREQYVSPVYDGGQHSIATRQLILAGGELVGLPGAALDVGAGGQYGSISYRYSKANDPSPVAAITVDGGDGGDGGGSVVIVSRGLAFDVAGQIITDGADGTLGTVQGGIISGAGGGGFPGFAAVFLDGAYTAPDLAEHHQANRGACPSNGTSWDGTWRTRTDSEPPTAAEAATKGYAVSSHSTAMSLVQFIPTDSIAIEDTGAPVHQVAAPELSGLQSGDAQLIRRVDGTIVSQIQATWTHNGDPDTAGFEIQARLVSESTWQTVIFTPDATLRRALFQAADDNRYDVRVRALALSPATASDWAVISGHYVVGKQAAPAAPSSFTVTGRAGQMREYTWALSNPPADLAGFRIRYSTTTTAAWDDMTPLHGSATGGNFLGLLTSSPFESQQLAAGTYRFAIKSVDTSGNESTTALYRTVTLGVPPIGESLAAADMFALGWPGTKVHCAVHPYSGELIPHTVRSLAQILEGDHKWDTAPHPDPEYTHIPLYIASNPVEFNLQMAITGGNNVTVSVASSSDGGASYGAFIPLSGVAGLVTATYIKIKLNWDT